MHTVGSEYDSNEEIADFIAAKIFFLNHTLPSLDSCNFIVNFLRFRQPKTTERHQKTTEKVCNAPI
jgi:hypothetical protein